MTMRAAYLCNDTDKLAYVYGQKQKERIARLCGGEPDVWTSVPEKAKGVRYLFSTWGMPSLSQEEIVRSLPDLNALFYAAGSVRNFAAPFLESGVRVFSAWRMNAVPVAQYAVSQILLACKGYFSVQALTRTDRAAAKALFSRYPGAYDVRVGILGCGAVGRAVCELLKPACLDVLAYDPYLTDADAQALGVTKASLAEIFATCLVVSNHTPNLPATVGLIRREHFFAMQPYATFINTGRGPQLDEADLCDALRAVPTRTALLDVLTNENDSDSNPLNALPNCFLTPHIAGSAGLEVHRMADCMADALQSVISGDPCENEVTPDMLQTMA